MMPRFRFGPAWLVGVLAALLVAWWGVSAWSQSDGPDYGPPGMGPGGMGPGDRDDVGPGGPGGRDPDDMGPRRSRGMGMGGGDDGGDEGLSSATVDVEGGQRPYYLHVPANLTKPAPVVFVLHGGGGRPQAIARRTDWTQAADQHGFVVVFPEGSPSPSGRGGTWNVGSGWTSASSDDIGYVAAILKDIGHNVQVDPARVYATGVSMGGVLSYRLACEMSDTFAAIAPVSATMVESECKPTSPVAILHIHGTDDDRIPLHGGHGQKTASKRSWPAPEKGIAAWSHFDACADSAPPHSTEGGADCESFQQCRAPVEMCVLSGGRHGWPEGATDQIWAFFAAHPKPAP